MKKPIVRIGGKIDSIAEIKWDGVGHSIMCNIRYVDVNPPRVPTLSEKLDRQFNITTVQKYFLIGGFFSMTLDSQKRIESWDIRTNPDKWIRGEQNFKEAIPATLQIDAEFELDGRASVEEPAKFYDPVRGTFYLSWGEVSIWYEIAPAVAVGVASDSTLAQIRLDDLHINTEDQEIEGLWSKLRHRFGF